MKLLAIALAATALATGAAYARPAHAAIVLADYDSDADDLAAKANDLEDEATRLRNLDAGEGLDLDSKANDLDDKAQELRDEAEKLRDLDN